MKTRNQLNPIELYDGNSQRPMITQIGGVDSTTSQAFWTGGQSITAGGEPEALPDKALNPGVCVTVKASIDNTSDIHIGYDITSSLWTASQSIRLVNGQSEKFGVDNLNRLYINSSNSGDGVELYLTTK